jgi:hypothetical protein
LEKEEANQLVGVGDLGKAVLECNNPKIFSRFDPMNIPLVFCGFGLINRWLAIG